MSNKDILNCRNIGIMAHIDAGKTTTTERILYYSGKIHKLGEVHEGNATTDWMQQEQERGITITSAAITCYWNKHQINIIDTPGHVDFTAEVERSLRVLDGAVVLIDGVSGVEPQTENIWQQITKYKVPNIIFINKMDRLGADFNYCCKDVSEKLNKNILVLQFPVFENENFTGIIDLIDMKSIIWNLESDYGKKYEIRKIDNQYIDIANEYRQKLLDYLFEFDDSLLENYLNNIEPSKSEILNLIKKLVLNNKASPILCGSAFKNIAIQPLLDNIIYFLPKPNDTQYIEGFSADKKETKITRKKCINESMSAIIFKIANDFFAGQIVFIRVYSGILKLGDQVYNSRTKKKQRIQKILRMSSNDRYELKEIKAGDICAVVGLKDVITGDTICDKKKPIRFESTSFPSPVISMAIEPRTKSDQDRLNAALNDLMNEDPTFKSHEDIDSGQIIISGMGELHLDIIIDRLKREFNLDINSGKPRVTYRETVTKKVVIEDVFDREINNVKKYAKIKIEISNSDKNFEFINKCPENKIPKIFIDSIKSGIEGGLESGVISGFPVINTKVLLIDGHGDQEYSDEKSFKIVSMSAIRKALQMAECVLLEPIMLIKITVPDNYLSGIVSDINSRSAKIKNISIHMNLQIIEADVPLSNMFGYSTKLRSLSQGRGNYSMKFSHYA